MAAFIIDNGTLWSDPEAIALRPKKRSRKWAPKKRTGCLTCRQRHVKCDEGKPCCRRCAIASRECVGDGYSTPAPPDAADESPDSESLLVPRRRPRLVFQPDVPLRPAGLRTASAQEMAQFHFLRQVAASSMAGVFDREFCSRDMLQATSFHPIVWHASCALAAMYQREALGGGVRSGEEAAAAVVADKRHSLRRFALEQYNESIAGVVGVLTEGGEELASLDLEVLLTTTLLFTAIASLQGDVPAAVLHVINGQRILHRWKRKLETTAARRGSAGGGGSSSSLLTPTCVEAVMGRLVSQSSAIRQKPWSEAYYRDLETPAAVSPAPFSSPADAYYEFEPLCKAYFELGENNKFILDPAEKQPPPGVRRAYAAALAAWTAKFDAMRARPGITDAPTNNEAILVLQARQIGMAIEVEKDPAGPESAWDAFNPRFAQIVALGESLQREEGAGRVFSFSSSMMDVFVLTATRCREHGVRRRARELLRRLDAREGLCNSRLGHAIAAAWAEIEEAPGRAKRDATGVDLLLGGDGCDCEAERFICNDHRVAALAGDFRVDDVGTMTYWTKRALDRGLPGEVREIVWAK